MSAGGPPVPGYRAKPLTVGCVQFNPKLKDVEGNAAKVREMTKRIQRSKVDLLVLPEMFLSGYMFSSRKDIDPYLENGRTGPTATLCGELARRCGCWVIGGYPERGEAGEDETTELVKAYNSAVVVSPEGAVFGNYRKSFLFDTDKSWAEEGEGFKVLDLPQPLGRTVVGICMDMNPKDFLSPFNAYELGNFVKRNNADLLVVPMNWLDPPAEPPSDPAAVAESRMNNEAPELSTLNYWAHRLTPLHDPAPSYTSEGIHDQGSEKTVVFVACNRTGTEEGTTFVGTSCVMTISSNPSGIDLIEAMGRKEEGVRFALIN